MRFLGDEEDFELPLGLVDHRLIPKYITTPITTWYSHEHPSSDKRRIQSVQLQPCKIAGSLKDCYQGWVVEKYNPITHQFYGDKSKAFGKRVYHHFSLPHRYFWRPFPRRGFGQDTCNPKQYQYMSCHTKQAWFHIAWDDSTVRPAFNDGLKFHAQTSLVDDLSRKCGWLQVPPTDEVALGLERSHVGSYDSDEDEPEPLSKLKVELVAICQRRESCLC